MNYEDIKKGDILEYYLGNPKILQGEVLMVTKNFWGKRVYAVQLGEFVVFIKDKNILTINN